jgi:hypothetical protein
MAELFPEVLPVRLSEGARQELANLAKSRYRSACSIARRASMAEIEKARREAQFEPAFCPITDAR